MTRLVVLGSVFLPREAMLPFCDALEEEVELVVPPDASSAEAVLRSYVEQLEGDRGAAVIAYSNAGNYVAALAERVGPTAVLFVDAAIPPFEGGTWPVVPRAMSERLGARVVDGALPRWTEWWPREDVLPLFPDVDRFDGIHSLTPRVDAAYLSVTLSARAGWADSLPAAYLRLSEGYEPQLDRARAAGWPTVALDVGHVGLLREPRATADAAIELLSALWLPSAIELPTAPDP